MRISFIPRRCDEAFVVSKAGDVLSINDEAFDFTSLPEGATLPEGEVPCDWIMGPVERIAGELRLTLLLPHGTWPEQWQAFPQPLEAVPDGPVDLPFNTVVSVKRVPVTGGFNVVTTTRRWHQPDQIDVAFEAAVNEELSNVDA